LLGFHAYITEMHGSRSKIPVKNLLRKRCADGFNSGVKGLTVSPHCGNPYSVPGQTARNSWRTQWQCNKLIRFPSADNTIVLLMLSTNTGGVEDQRVFSHRYQGVTVRLNLNVISDVRSYALDREDRVSGETIVTILHSSYRNRNVGK
jgi:hypothetical protein